MTRKLPAILLPLLLLVFTSVTNAQTTTANIQTTASSASKLREQIQLLQEQKKTTVTQVKNDAKSLIQIKRDEFNTRLQSIKDQKKKALIERIDAKLTEINKNHTTKFTEVINMLQTFLDKINKSATGTATLTDVTAAQDAINVAKAAVEVQAAKSYIMTIADDLTLKLNAGTTVSQIRQNLMAVYKLVIDAKQAVQKLNTDKALIKKEATSSAK